MPFPLHYVHEPALLNLIKLFSSSFFPSRSRPPPKDVLTWFEPGPSTSAETAARQTVTIHPDISPGVASSTVLGTVMTTQQP